MLAHTLIKNQHVHYNSYFLIYEDNAYTEIEVLDVVDLNFKDVNELIDIDDTVTRYMMAAAWRVTDQKGLDIKW